MPEELPDHQIQNDMQDHRWEEKNELATNAEHFSGHSVPPCLGQLLLSCAFLPPAGAQSCGSKGVATQVLGSGGPELQDQRASSSYLVWEDGRARVLVDMGGGSALRFGESGAQASQLDVILFSHFHVITAPISRRWRGA